jgi:hypothetical protein
MFPKWSPLVPTLQTPLSDSTLAVDLVNTKLIRRQMHGFTFVRPHNNACPVHGNRLRAPNSGAVLCNKRFVKITCDCSLAEHKSEVPSADGATALKTVKWAETTYTRVPFSRY